MSQSQGASLLSAFLSVPLGSGDERGAAGRATAVWFIIVPTKAVVWMCSSESIDIGSNYVLPLLYHVGK